MDTEEVSNRYVAPGFVNGLEAYDCEINLGMEENMISNEFSLKLCREYEDLLLEDLDFGDILDIEGVEVAPFVCKMGKSSRNKRKQLEKFYICERYSLLEKERRVIETMAYRNKYKKILDGICIDKMKLDGEMKKDEEDAIIKIKGEALKEKEDPRAFVISIRLECEINLNALAYTGFDINAEPMGLLKDVLCQHVDWKPNYTGCINKNEEGDGQWHAEIRLTDPYGNIYDQGFFAKRLGLYNSEEIKDEGFDVYFQGGLCSDEHFNAQEYWLSISREENLSLSRSHASTIQNPVLMVLHKMITYGLCQRTTGEIDEEERSWLIPEAPDPGVPRVFIPRPPRASMQEFHGWGYIVSMGREPITHLDMIRSSMTSIISSTYPVIAAASQMNKIASVEMTRVGCVSACFGSRMF
ncbi:hypothetical protein Tco_0226896 [Tanacetum coccineum]